MFLLFPIISRFLCCFSPFEPKSVKIQADYYHCFMEKNYNIDRKHLQLPEYGRHIHQMVDNLMTIEDRTERNRKARYVIDVMGNLNPLLRDTPEFTHKLWDHLFIMSDFRLDVDSPYPIPTSLTLTPVPDRMPYPDKRVDMKHYGKYVRRIINSLKEVRDREAVQDTVSDIARFMRTKSYEYNQEHPNNEAIIKDIKRMSDHRIDVDEEALSMIKSEYKQAVTLRQAAGKKGVYSKKNGKTVKPGVQSRHHK